MNDPDWFETWFNTTYYHQLYRHRDQNEAKVFLDNLIREIKLPAGSHILDLACGRGRHAVHLHKKGFRVTGVDLSEENIKYTKRQSQPGLHFQTGDMRDNLGENEYDAVVNLFTSFGYFDNHSDNQKVIDNIYRALKSGGFFVFDYLNASSLKEINTSHEEQRTVDNTRFYIRRKIESQKIIKEIEVTDGSKKCSFHEQVALIFPEEFQSMFTRSGFHILEHWGDYELKPFNPSHSNRCIIYARK
jgi:SAM-dependent methyltransferase